MAERISASPARSLDKAGSSRSEDTSAAKDTIAHDTIDETTKDKVETTKSQPGGVEETTSFHASNQEDYRASRTVSNEKSKTFTLCDICFEQVTSVFKHIYDHNHSPPLETGTVSGESKTLVPPPSATSLDIVHGEDEGKDETSSSQPPDIRYRIRYEDDSGYLIREASDTKPFIEELELKSDDIPILEITTTAVVSDRQHYNVWSQEGFKNQNMITSYWRPTSIKIQSPHILAALRSVVDYYPDHNISESSVTLAEPYYLFFHHEDELRNIHKSFPSDSEQSRHMTVLFNYIDQTFEKRFAKERERQALAEGKTPKTTFDFLWMLYKPGTDVYADMNGKTAGFVVKSIKFIPVQAPNNGYYDISMWYLDFNGRYVGRVPHTAYISYFAGERDIASLAVVPCQYQESGTQGDKTLRHRLEERGKKFFRLLVGRQVEYRGYSLGEPKRKYEGRVYIDPAAFYLRRLPDPDAFGSSPLGVNSPLELGLIQDDGTGILGSSPEIAKKRRALCATFKWLEYDDIDLETVTGLSKQEQDSELDKHRFFLCTHRVMGLFLKSRQWEIFDVEGVSEAQIYPKIIDRLVLNPHSRLEMIKSLVARWSLETPESPKPWTADHVQSKGDGQIFLLHGRPGVGKTFTAECVAECTRRPLLSLTCGDIGTEETDVEHHLAKWFNLAEKWNAVLLIDEADVYLEKRSTSDLRRNSLVSVFLRAMEYYRGLLFLTTNRVGHFDDAFVSRIHVVISYEDLNQEGRAKIWNGFFDKLEQERENISITARAKKLLLEECKIPWNGREIRNAFQTAVALAEYQADPKADVIRVDKKHFEEIISMSDEFRKYLFSIEERSESQRARNEGWRNDQTSRSG